MRALLLAALLAPGPALAQSIIFQEDVTGGVAVDATGASTRYNGATTWTSAEEDFDIVVPATATVTEVYAVLMPKSSGFYGDPAPKITINGVLLSSATLVDAATWSRSYSLDPATFGITGAGSYPYAERDDLETGYNSGYGVTGATLVVVFEDSTVGAPRQVTLATDSLYGSGDSTVLTGLPTDSAATSALLSIGMTWECSNEQNSSISADGTLLTSYAGGRDDGKTYDVACSSQDWNSLTTQGSFGYDDTGALVGADGDDPWTEPGGTSTNSRLSDELYEIAWSDAGSLQVGFTDSTRDSWLTTMVVVVDLVDRDSDGVADPDDDCPDDYDPAQLDADGDGEGDVCDACTDVDGDGWGDTGYTATTCDADCDDSDADVHPGATEVWYDGTDQDCDGASDYDQDGDGYDHDAFGGADCDDGDAAINPAATEAWYDGVDQDCDGADDYDQDADGYRASAHGGLDCNDADAAINPSASEIYYDGVDQDCDGASDFDADGVGHDSDAHGGDDCDDSSAAIHPGATDRWYDGIDSDCDGASDYDQDGDGHDSDRYGGDDCDDVRAAVHPGAAEIWYDGVDQDCDGASDYDQDGDGYLAAAYGGADCDDTDPAVNPAATEVYYDGVDQDCDGASDYDQDGDG
ncbi:MAG: putative metal-binding motif-containing protein, partial [Pseudomonadota bacterium]